VDVRLSALRVVDLRDPLRREVPVQCREIVEHYSR
jgi:hypothetical protein